ncbi:SRPBCC family protein [Stackebrandtia nassauensis]|uniref:Activator of Hsp90 ATPase 1 family protein n=1 Tax=Stackebrandtia nassauensis (strain DSM 44728 / CIP 108903 / NRRL B-16338 / NBRC 102104 / LLR-40K-21) TaxID=446470 RepID=D3Q1T2_STANL|nr:SRPBCC domain-containing protein [Stackebrandtia nassauensis]ADD39930.1 Activator of Hsp90 ATPase 1 family protein [Stackebrandtia nassauensis DSM 44728]
MTEGKRLEKEIELDASVDEVWEAVSTGQGFATWFVPHDIKTDENGVPVVAEGDFGSGNTDQGRLLEWEPKRRVKFGNYSSDSTQVLEFLVEGKDSGSTVLRLVQSGAQGEDWEMEYHSKGWDLFFQNLREYLEYFRGKPVANALVMSFTTVDAKTVWERMYAALGANRDLAVGDLVELTPKGVEPIKGTVDIAVPGAVLGVRTEDGLYRFGGQGADAWGMVNAFHYRYGTDVDPAEWTERWQRWINEVFPPSEAPQAQPA